MYIIVVILTFPPYILPDVVRTVQVVVLAMWQLTLQGRRDKGQTMLGFQPRWRDTDIGRPSQKLFKDIAP